MEIDILVYEKWIVVSNLEFTCQVFMIRIIIYFYYMLKIKWILL